MEFSCLEKFVLYLIKCYTGEVLMCTSCGNCGKWNPEEKRHCAQSDRKSEENHQDQTWEKPVFFTNKAEHNRITSVNLSTFTNPEKYPVSRAFPS